MKLSHRRIRSDRRNYIRVLELVADTKKTPDETDAAFNGELIVEGYLAGEVLRNEFGSIVLAGITGMTVKGRLFLEQLRQDDVDDSWLGWARKLAPFTSGLLVGVTVPILTAWLKARLHLP